MDTNFTKQGKIQKIYDYAGFCKLLHYRFHSAIKHVLGFRGRFTLMINTYDHRNQTNEFSVYAGVEKQRQLLEGVNKEKKLDWAWNFLETCVIKEGTEGAKYKKKYVNNEYKLEDVEIKSLDSDYFGALGDGLMEHQKAEKAILNHHFNIRDVRL